MDLAKLLCGQRGTKIGVAVTIASASARERPLLPKVLERELSHKGSVVRLDGPL
jgi:hypothetical protein